VNFPEDFPGKGYQKCVKKGTKCVKQGTISRQPVLPKDASEASPPVKKGLSDEEINKRGLAAAEQYQSLQKVSAQQPSDGAGSGSDGGGPRNQLVHEQKTTQRESHLNIIQKCIGEVLPALNQTDKTLIEQVILLENEIFGTNYDPDASFCQRVDRIANNIGVSVLKS
jgi:hypothetical protein